MNDSKVKGKSKPNRSSKSEANRTFNIKQTQRFQSKKRKLESFLSLVAKDEPCPPFQKKKLKETLEDSVKTLRNELQKYMKKNEKSPFFALTQIGLKSHVNLKNHKTSQRNNLSPLFVEDICNLLLRSLLGSVSPNIRWAKIDRANNVVKTVLLVVDGLTKACVIENLCLLQNVIETFPITVEIASSHLPFAKELSTLHLQLMDRSAYSALFPVEDKEDEGLGNKNKPSKLHLLLSPIQMVMENFPLPNCIYELSKSTGYVFTKQLYSPVTENSPMFAIDCEMCGTLSDNNAVTRVAIVNEDLETVFHSFVKPADKIVDYRTRYSGVTRELLENVTTTLSDVHKAIQKKLPPDAILCGQSLNCDLHALKMIHPYVIDTSVIFNISGTRSRKISLKNLMAKHLDEAIQQGTKGHSPIEDSAATMKLVLLKLGNTVQFGDAVLKNALSNKAKDESKIENIQQSQENCEMQSDDKSNSNDDGFFNKIINGSKKVCIVGNKTSLDLYSGSLPNEVVTISKSNVKKIIKATLNNLDNFDFVITHLPFEKDVKSSFLEELNIQIKTLYEACPRRTLFMTVASGVEEFAVDFSSGLCMTALKK